MLKKLLGTVIVACSFFIISPAYAYTVQSGDTLYEISVRNDMSLGDLIALNPQIQDPNWIYIGENVITSDNNNVTNKSTVEGYSPAELDLLARLVRAEARGESFTGKVAVAEVVINRTHSPSFPDTLTGVINQKGQFSPVSNGAINTPADTDSINAVHEAVNNGTNLDGAVFFYNPNTATSRWLDGKPTVTTIGNHVFKK
jgi:N-acetylmuramoyl-L-alanine amidase